MAFSGYSEQNKLIKKNRFKRRWYRLMMVASSIVVFCTTYALILPAITMEKGCELPEHTHTKDCYEEITQSLLSCSEKGLVQHKHTKKCKNEDGEYICGYADFVLHTHNDSCYDENDELICALEEIEEHTHSSSCYSSTKAHKHTEDCYSTARGKLICAEKEVKGHTHTDKCIKTEQGPLICGEEESEGHKHSADCYTTEEVCTCGKKESEGHTHDEDCYKTKKTKVCDDDSEEHEHTDACYEFEEVLACGQKESKGHAHTSDCFEEKKELSCDSEESKGHTHTNKCYEQNEEIVCDKEESEGHIHTDDCYELEETLTCGKKESEGSEKTLDCDREELLAHEHTEDCFAADGTVCCGKTQVLRHSHTDSCFKTKAVTKLICDMEEHTHTDACTKPAKKPLLEDVEGTEEVHHTAGRRAEDELALMASHPKLTDDSAYVTSISIMSYTTGTAPFDADDTPGNDSSKDNDIIRTFDTLSYSFNVLYTSHTIGDMYEEARVKLEFVLPVTQKEAEFDLSAMAWMENPVVKTETRDGKTCQVLTCYKHLLPSAGSQAVVPGEFGENVTINVKMMENGSVLTPTFSAAMEYSTWDGLCPTHGFAEKMSITARPITISAAPKYNIEINKAFATEAKQNYDFSTRIAGMHEPLNLDAGIRLGRIFTYGVTLQLYNTSSDKGLRGIELPAGDITFDLKLDTQFTPYYQKVDAPSDVQSGTTVDATTDYTPLVWSYSPQSYENTERSIAMTSYTQAYRGAPYNRYVPGNPHYGSRTNACYNGGTWSVSQDGSIIHVTVSGYDFDGIFPRLRAGENDGDSGYYKKDTGVANIGCFSAMKLYIVQPFQKKADAGTTRNVLDDFSDEESKKQDVGTGYCLDGNFTMTVSAINLQATTISGQTLPDAPNDNSNQTSKTTNISKETVNLKRDGTYELRHLYSPKDVAGMNDVFGYSEATAGSCAQNGNDWAVIGSTIGLTIGGYAQTNGDDDNKMCAAKWLMKFDATAFEPVAGGTKANTMAWPYKYCFLYGVKPDGSDWTTDKEMKETTIEKLCYYSTVAEAQTHGEIVAFLVEAEPKSTVANIPAGILTTYYCQNVKIREDINLIDKYFITTGESYVWCVPQYTAATEDGKSIPSMLGNDPSDPIELPQWTHVKNKPSTYKNGDGVHDKHEGSYSIGDTILILGYKASITKGLEQKSSGTTAKTTYNLDTDQRVIDFVLASTVKFDDDRKLDEPIKTTVTIVDTLPKYLKYHVGSSYLGGEYAQTSTYGGTLGRITGGESKEPIVTTNADGIQTLTWVLNDVTVGEPIPSIHYAADIGTKGNETQDVKTGTTSLVNTASISALGDNRKQTIANGNVSNVGFNLTRGQASAYGKYARSDTVEQDGTLDYVVYYDNNSSTEVSGLYLLDTMPYNGEFDNDFTGAYSVKSWRINAEKCHTQNFTLYYTTDPAYAGKTSAEIPRDVVVGTWTKAEVLPRWVVNDPEDSTTGLTNLHQVDLLETTVNGTTYKATGDDPYIQPNSVLLAGYNCKDIESVRVVASGIPSGDKMQLFWKNTGDSDWTEAKSIKVDSTTEAKSTYEFKVSEKTNWGETLTGLRLDPFDKRVGQEFTIHSINFLTAQPTYDLSTGQSFFWQIDNAKELTTDANGTIYRITDSDTRFKLKNELFEDYSCEQIDSIRVVASGIPTGDSMQIFFATDTETELDEKKSISIKSTTPEETTYEFKFSKNPSWKGKLCELRLDPVLGHGFNVTIKSITFVTSAEGLAPSLVGKKPVAWALIGTLGANESVSIDLSLQLEPGASSGRINEYHNMFSHGTVSTKTDERTVTRSLAGTAWLDANSDGLQDVGEEKLSGVSVSLYKLKAGGNAATEADYEPVYYPGTTTPIVIETGQSISILSTGAADATTYETGRYRFTDLPFGTFAVKFSDGHYKISPHIASPTHRDGSEDIRDSDGVPTYVDANKSAIKHTFIAGIVLPHADRMSVSRYESNFNDSGFYKRGYELPETGGSGKTPYTVGGLLLTTAALILLYRKYTSKGGSSDF